MKGVPHHQAQTFAQRVRELLEQLEAPDPLASKDEALFGTVTEARRWSPERIAQVFSRHAEPTMYKRLDSSATGATTNFMQPWFPSAGGVLVNGGTMYFFSGLFILTTTSPGNYSVNVSLGGTATAGEYAWFSTSHRGNTTINTSQSTRLVRGTADLSTGRLITTNASSPDLALQIEGWFVTDADGTIIPQFQYSGAISASQIESGTWFALWDWGTSSRAEKGVWA